MKSKLSNIQSKSRENNMKKVISCFILVAMMVSVFALNCSAAEVKNNITYFEDGSYIIDTIVINSGRASGSIQGERIKTYYDNSGSLDWQAVLTGIFTYTGSSATCTSSSVNVTIYDSSWYTISKSATKSANVASASATMGCKILGVTYNEVTVPITLTCDANGNLS